ncbi:MAG TPA: glycosyltransferase family 39 protein, partial [Candidatus Goldiibacteriota bacterium]|nr:glycosyltransferase family 39 protein [Candidatus Goldiibacteriota bacterium]
MIFGTSVTAVRLFTAFYAALTCVILFVAARRDYGNRAAGIAAFLCAIFYGGVHFQAVNSNTEIFAALPLLLSYYFAGDKNIKKGSFLSGFFFAVSFFMKEIVFLFGALVLARLLIKKELRRAVPFFAAGILAVSAAVFAWLAANNLPAYYAECVISYNLFYSLKNAGGEPRVMAYFAAIHAPLTLGAVMMFTRKDPAEDGSWLLKACVIACAAGILAFGFRYRHYF